MHHYYCQNVGGGNLQGKLETITIPYNTITNKETIHEKVKILKYIKGLRKNIL